MELLYVILGALVGAGLLPLYRFVMDLAKKKANPDDGGTVTAILDKADELLAPLVKDGSEKLVEFLEKKKEEAQNKD